MLLKKWFYEKLSLPQQVALKVAYGCDLSADRKDLRGWSELDYWAMFQESCTYDTLGYLQSVIPVPYVPKEYPEVWGIVGVRGGKTDRLAATITAYEATCGGHEAYARKGRPLICFSVAQDLRMAKYSLHSIKGVIEEMPWFAKAIVNVTADRIDLNNGVTIATTPPTVKSIRGYDSPVGVMDEVAVWYTEADSANPDFEVYRQLSSRQASFDYPKIVGISSAWASVGLLYDRWQAGTEGKKVRCEDCRHHPQEGCPVCARLRVPHAGKLILHTTTPGLGNPHIKREWLAGQQAADPVAFAREYLTQFQSAVSGFLDAFKLDAAVDPAITERKPEERNVYIAAMDPAFRHDSFALAIGHMDPKLGVVVDVIRRWVPQPGTTLNPADIMPEIAAQVKRYRTGIIYSDQYQFEALNVLAMQLGFSIIPVDFTASSKADIYGNLKALVAQGRLRLLDEPDTLQELKRLERKLSQGGTVSVAAPQGQHDDLATVVALMAHKAVWLDPMPEEVSPKEPTVFEKCQAQIAERKQQGLSEEDW